MTDLLQQAFQKASELDANAQDRFAEFLLDELESDQKWDSLLAQSAPDLARLAEEAANEYRNGQTEPGGFGGS